MWDDQGKTDTVTASFCLDDWNQIVAHWSETRSGLAVFEEPAWQFLRKTFSPVSPRSTAGEAERFGNTSPNHAFWGLHAWRNAGLMLGLRCRD